MANLVRQFPSGAPSNGELPSSAVEYIDAALPKVPNATDGSTHTGSCEFGGLKASHLTEKSLATTTSGAGPHAITVDFNVTNHRFVKVAAQATDQVVNFTVTNPREGDMGSVLVKKVDGQNRILSLTWSANCRIGLGDNCVDNDANAEAITRFDLRGVNDPDDGGLIVHIKNMGTYKAG